MSSDMDTALYLLTVTDYLYKTFGLFILITSTVGNLCNCFVFLRISPLNKHPNALFLTGSSIGSLLFINTSLWTIIIRILTGIDFMNQSLVWCKISAWLTYSGGCFSFMCNCFAGFCQLLILLPNTDWPRLITRMKAKIIILFIAVSYLLIFIPMPIYNTSFQASTGAFICASTSPTIDIYVSYWAIVGYYFLPALLTLILFGLIWYNFQQFRQRRHNIEGVVTRMMLIQMSSILTSGVPAGVFVCYIMVTQSILKTPVRLSYELLIFVVLTLFTFLTNGTSFWIYLLSSKPFRKHLRVYISEWKLFNTRTQPLSPTIRINTSQ